MLSTMQSSSAPEFLLVATIYEIQLCYITETPSIATDPYLRAKLSLLRCYHSAAQIDKHSSL